MSAQERPNCVAHENRLSALEEAMQSSKDELRELFREELRKEFELVGLSASTPEGRVEIRKDMEFARTMRKGASAAAAKIGWAVIMLGAAGFSALVAYGAKIKIVGS